MGRRRMGIVMCLLASMGNLTQAPELLLAAWPSHGPPACTGRGLMPLPPAKPGAGQQGGGQPGEYVMPPMGLPAGWLFPPNMLPAGYMPAQPGLHVQGQCVTYQ